MKFPKRLIATISTIAFLSLSFSPVLAAGPSGPTGPRGPVGPQGQVGPTGPTGPSDPVGPNGSTNTEGTTTADSSDSQTQESTSADLEEVASIENQTDLTMSTGGNTVSENTAVSSFTTGNVNGDITNINTANSVFSDESTISTTVQNGGINNVVFGDSHTTTQLKSGANYLVSGESILEIDNDSSVVNPINIEADTGDNLFSENTMIGNITTGDINLGVNLINLLNLYNPNLILSLDILSIFGDLTADIILPETSNASTTNSDIHVTDLAIDQDANVDNTVDIQTNTGANKIGSLTAAGDIDTGDSNVKASVSNILNILAIPYFYILNIFGDWDGNLLGLDPALVLINNQSGQNEINSSSSQIASINNDANVENRLSIDANTGRNTVEDSTVIGNLKTGSINIAANIVNILNSISQGTGKLRIGIINIFGNWKGNLKSKDYNVGDITDDNDPPKEDWVIDPEPDVTPFNESLPIFITVNPDSSHSNIANARKLALNTSQKQNNSNMTNSLSDAILAKGGETEKNTYWLKMLMGLIAIASAWIAIEMFLKYKSVENE